MTVDRWGMDIGGSPESIAAWNEAWDRFLHFTGDPLELLTEANENDDDFVMGSVLAAIYAVTAGAPLDAPTIVDSVARPITLFWLSTRRLDCFFTPNTLHWLVNSPSIRRVNTIESTSR